MFLFSLYLNVNLLLVDGFFLSFHTSALCGQHGTLRPRPGTSTGRPPAALAFKSATTAKVETGIVTDPSTASWPPSQLPYYITTAAHVETGIVTDSSTASWPQSCLAYYVTTAAHVESRIIPTPSAICPGPTALSCFQYV